MTDTLQALFDSTAALYTRFGIDDISSRDRQRIFMEEVLELIQISCEVEPWEDPGEHGRSWVAEEATDVFVTVVGLLLSHKISRNELDAAIQRVIAKNDAKTAANGYALIGGKIRKVTPAQSQEDAP